jgi:hypothetical protein
MMSFVIHEFKNILIVIAPFKKFMISELSNHHLSQHDPASTTPSLSPATSLHPLPLVARLPLSVLLLLEVVPLLKMAAILLV